MTTTSNAAGSRASGATPTRTRLKGVGVAVLALALVAVAWRLETVHRTYGEWRLAATAPSARVHALGRDFGSDPRDEAPPDYVLAGHTSGGLEVFAPDLVAPQIFPAVILVLADGEYWSYELVGGP